MKNQIVHIQSKILNMFWEYWLNISTRGVTGADPGEPENIHYGTINYSTIQGIMKHLGLQLSDVFIDLGCGKGRALCCAARYKILAAIGVEYSQVLAAAAKMNVEKLRRKHAPIHIEHMLAQDFDFSKGTIFYMFHPFGPKVLHQVLQKMELGWKNNQRKIRIVYVNPVHEAILMNCDWLEMYDRWEPYKNGKNEHVISFWRSKDSMKTSHP